MEDHIDLEAKLTSLLQRCHEKRPIRTGPTQGNRLTRDLVLDAQATNRNWFGTGLFRESSLQPDKVSSAAKVFKWYGVSHIGVFQVEHLVGPTGDVPPTLRELPPQTRGKRISRLCQRPLRFRR